MNAALHWTRAAANDLRRLLYFLSVVNDDAATRAIRLIVVRSRRIAEHPGLGARLARYGNLEVRRIVVGHYEIRNVVRDSEVTILQVFHHRVRR